MRIVLDMQGAQSPGSRSRGIGRYTMAIAKAIARNRKEHEIILALNGRFSDTLDPIREAFKGLLPDENIRVWTSLTDVSHANIDNNQRRQSAELIYEAFLDSLQPDFVYITSLIEGLDSDAVTSIRQVASRFQVAVTLYDLIPYINPKPYLENQAVKSWYLDKIDHLKRADVWLGISESSRQEGLDHLALPSDRAVNISTDADAWFKPIEVSTAQRAALAKKFHLDRPFVLYTGGIDHRKNVEGLIRAYALLPAELRQQYQLAIVCSIQPAGRQALEKLIREQGLDERDIVLTGFVSDEELRDFYNLCSLFVFPSWHEGFGLPALEAMRCGALVIGANTSSLPEVIGWDEALFDPRDDKDIARHISRGLEDAAFREALAQHGREQAAKFSWDESGRRALRAMEDAHRQRAVRQAPDAGPGRRPKLAYVSPLPPQRSGISDYSAELLPALAEFYDIDVVVAQDEVTDPWIKANCPIRTPKWLVENAESYERVLYHLGNSEFHQHMFDLLKIVPGVVVLHDFFLSGILAHVDLNGSVPGAFAKALYFSHGYGAVRDRYQARDIADTIYQYPCSLGVIQDSLGMIAHSPYSVRLAKRWYAGDDESDWAVIPLMRDSRQKWERDEARKALGIKEDDFLVCTFGLLGPTKLNHRLLDAWLESTLARDKTCHLVFVGENQEGDYGQALTRLIRSRKMEDNVRITGWADADTFHQYLAAADIGVQLRALSRGETSAAVLDCMNYGKAVIANANGSMADLDQEAVWMLPNEFNDGQLVEALEALRSDAQRRAHMGAAARDIMLTRHAPATCARQYRDAIERFYLTALPHPAFLARTLAAKGISDRSAMIKAASAMARNFAPKSRQRQLLVDVTDLCKEGHTDATRVAALGIIKSWLDNPPRGYRVEPVHALVGRSYRYAREFAAQLLGYVDSGLQDELIDYWPGDALLSQGKQLDVVFANRGMRENGVKVHIFTAWEDALRDLPDARA